MDKNTLAGMVIIGVLLLGFTWYSSNQSEKNMRERIAADSVEMVRNRNVREAERAESTQNAALPGADSALLTHLGESLFAAKHAEEERYVVENDLVKFTFSNRGAQIKSIELKEYDTFRDEQVRLFADSMALFDLSFFIQQQYNSLQIRTSEYCFSTDLPSHVTVGESGLEIAMRLPVDSEAYVEYVYTIRKDDYMIGFDVRFVDMTRLLANQPDFEVTWEHLSIQNERSFDNENNFTTINYKFPNTRNNDLEDLGISKDSRERHESTRIKWISFRQQFFSCVFIAENDFQNAWMRFDPAGVDGKIKHFRSKISVPVNPADHTYKFRFYYGPNRYTLLRSYDLGMQRMIPLGWGIFGAINRWIVIPVFHFLEGFIASYGIIILLLTIFIKLLILPLTYKSYLSSAKMRLLKPEMDALNAKFPKQEDAMKKQQAVMALYKSAGVSPMGGCIPLLIQMPVLFALFRFFPASIELRRQSFLWADDLSSYDSVLELPFNIPFYGDHVSLFTLLMAVSIFITSRISYQQTAQAGPQMAGMKFMMLYMMPVMLLAFFNNYASGLTYYYLLSNIISIGQTYTFRYAIDDNKLHAQMKANAKKPPKPKSKFAQRYEEAIKAQQQQQRQQKKRK